MRIQHNIMAMSAYRNYTNNVSAMKKNLEKLSSGYKINRAGDDAAGLAISEKMRAQITGLETAQKNAKDGISLVQTAEGALTEVHDMLNRMVELASQSANGTYDDTLDRDQMQKELNELRSEINRIADSSNFNGINLLDGSMQTGTVTGVTYTDMDAAAVKGLFQETDWTGKSQLDVDSGKGVLETEAVAASKAGFQISLDNIGSIKGTGEDFNLQIGDPADNGVLVSATLTNGTTYTASSLASALAAANPNGITYDGATYKVTAEGNTLKFESDDEADLKTAETITWYVGDTAPDPTDTSVKYTVDLSAFAEDGANELATGDKITIAGQDITIGTDLEDTFTNNTTVTDADGNTYSLEFDADTNTLTITADDDTVPAPTVSGGEAGTDATVNAQGGASVAGSAGTASSGTATLTQTGDTLTIDGTTIDFDSAAVVGTATDTANGKYTYTVSGDAASGWVVSVTAKNVGTAGDATFSGTIGGAAGTLATTGGADAKKSYAEYDLSTWAAGATGSLTIGDETFNWDTDLATTVAQFNNANFNLTVDGNTLKVEAKTAGAIAPGGDEASAIGVSTNDAPAPTSADVTKVESPKAGYINTGMQNPTSFNDGGSALVAHGSVDFSSAFSDGSKIKIGDTTYTVALGADSKFKNASNVVNLTDMETVDNQIAAERLAAAAKDNATFTVGHDGNGITTLQQKTSVKETTDMSTVDKFASYLGVSTASADSLENAKVGRSLTLQIGDTADSFNQLKVEIKDCHTDAMGIANISVANQEDAAAALDAIKSAINYVSDVRGTLGATQNRLDHTINNLSVMTENIQDAESTIRDVDVAEEMMAYTKNNILIQSAQAMLAQANQVPQGVLQLLQ